MPNPANGLDRGRRRQAALHEGVAAVASPLAAELYRLTIRAQAIQDVKENRTRFLVIGKRLAAPSGSGRDKTSCSCPSKTGSAPCTICWAFFKDARLNLTKIESRPTKRKARGSTSFFHRLPGAIFPRQVQKVVEKLKANCLFVKLLGSYPRPTDDGQRSDCAAPPKSPIHALRAGPRHGHGQNVWVDARGQARLQRKRPRAVPKGAGGAAQSHRGEPLSRWFQHRIAPGAGGPSGRQVGTVTVGAGSDELIEILAKAYLTPDDDIVVSGPRVHPLQNGGN